MQTKEEFLVSKFNWIGRQDYSKRISSSDISISRVWWDKPKKIKGYSFVFRNETSSKLGDHFEFAIDENVIIFRPAKDGIAMTQRESSSASNRYAKVKETEDTVKLLEFIGDYDLKYNQLFGLFYIERSKEDA